MSAIFLIDIDRPGIGHQLTLRGVRPNLVATVDDLRARAAAAVMVLNALPDAQVLAGIRAWWPGPIMLLVDGYEQAIVSALDAGYDDAVSTTSSDALIAARLAALVRWQGNARDLRIGDLVIDTIDCRVKRGGLPIALLPREYRLLIELARCPGAVVSRQALVAALCGLSFDPGTKVIEVHVSRLRAKIDRGFDVPMVLTEKGQGYRLAAPTSDRAASLTIAATAANR